MIDLKSSQAPVSTITFNRNEFDAPTENIYEAISITAKRAIQINSEIKKELLEKLEEFATSSDTIEEISENKEQIEISNLIGQHTLVWAPSNYHIKEFNLLQLNLQEIFKSMLVI